MRGRRSIKRRSVSAVFSGSDLMKAEQRSGRSTCHQKVTAHQFTLVWTLKTKRKTEVCSSSFTYHSKDEKRQSDGQLFNRFHHQSPVSRSTLVNFVNKMKKKIYVSRRNTVKSCSANVASGLQ